MVCGKSGFGRLESSASAEFSELPRRHLGTEGIRRTTRTRWTALEESRKMILAADIGGTNARLALFHQQNAHSTLVSPTTSPTRQPPHPYTTVPEPPTT